MLGRGISEPLYILSIHGFQFVWNRNSWSSRRRMYERVTILNRVQTIHGKTSSKINYIIHVRHAPSRQMFKRYDAFLTCGIDLSGISSKLPSSYLDLHIFTYSVSKCTWLELHTTRLVCKPRRLHRNPLLLSIRTLTHSTWMRTTVVGELLCCITPVDYADIPVV